MKSEARSPQEYISSLEDPRKSEIRKMHQLIRKTVPSLKPHITFGMLGYGMFHYKYASGREGDWPLIGLASQKNYISLYVCMTDGKQYIAEKYRKQLPKANIGKSCIRFKRLSDVDLRVIETIMKETEKAGKASSGGG